MIEINLLPGARAQKRGSGRGLDLAALLGFIRQAITDPWLAVSAVATVEGKEVTEFTLDLVYERPDPALLQTVPLPIVVR